jgi:TRAP-type transport system periplasmic protein
MAASGNVIAELSAEETAQIMAVGAGVTSRWIAEMDAKGYDGAALVAAAQLAVEANIRE